MNRESDGVQPCMCSSVALYWGLVSSVTHVSRCYEGAQCALNKPGAVNESGKHSYELPVRQFGLLCAAVRLLCSSLAGLCAAVRCSSQVQQSGAAEAFISCIVCAPSPFIHFRFSSVLAIAAMVLQPMPHIHVHLGIDYVTTLDNKITHALTTGARACATCGAFALGPDDQGQNFRHQGRVAGVNDSAQVLSPITKDYSQVEEHNERVYVCGSCRRNPVHSLSQFLPMSNDAYNHALVSVPLNLLHTTSFVDVSYRLTNESYGYVTGQFAPHSLLHGPLLDTREEDANGHHQGSMQYIKSYLTNNNCL